MSHGELTHHGVFKVHLSFVRSIQMDSWTEKQIAAMESRW